MSLAAFPPYNGWIDDNNGSKVVIIGCVLPAIATVFVFLRLLLRYTQKTGIGADDVTIVATLLMIWAISACIIFVWHNGMGLNVPEVPVQNLRQFLKSLYAFELFYIADFGCCKVSILLFYQRVFSVTRQRRNIVWGLIAFMVFFTFVFEIVFVFQCTPIHFFWTRVEDPVDGTCMNSLILYGVYTGINIITDLLIWLYPLPIVWKLHVNMQQKIGLALVFLVGALVCVVSIIRASTIPKIVSKNFTYDDVDAAIWAIVECSLCCICACLPTIRALFISHKRKNASHGPSSGPSSHPSRSGGASKYWFKSAGSLPSVTSSTGGGKKWGSGGRDINIETTVVAETEDGVPLTSPKAGDGWKKLEEGHGGGLGPAHYNGQPEQGKYGW